MCCLGQWHLDHAHSRGLTGVAGHAGWCTPGDRDTWLQRRRGPAEPLPGTSDCSGGGPADASPSVPVTAPHLMRSRLKHQAYETSSSPINFR